MAKHFTILHLKDGGIANKKAIRLLFTGLKDGRYEVSVKSLNARSSEANRYYWGYVIVEAQSGFRELGHELSKEEVHAFFKSRFNYEEIVNTDTGECLQMPKSTANLPKDKFSEYIGKIQQFCAEWLNTVILDAGIQTEIF